MKCSLIMVLCFVSSIVFAQNKFQISGKMDKVENGTKVYLMYRDVNDVNVLDSVLLKKNKFVFKGEVMSPTFAKITMMHGGKSTGEADELSVYLDKGKLTVKGEDFVQNATTSGMKINDDYNRYTTYVSSPENKVKAMEKKWNAASPEKRKELSYERRHTIQMAKREKVELQNSFIGENPKSYFSLVALSEVAGREIDVPVIQPIFMSLSEDIRNSERGLMFQQKIDAAKLIGIGAIAPDFIQNDVNDKPVRLSDFRGKYVLLDFWASWCGPCREESPNLVKNYEKYKDRNFTILGVSLDNPGKKQNWVEAMEMDKLHWTNVSDLQGWKNAVAKLYGVSSVPRSYLIDPAGKIIAINPRGVELAKALEKHLGK